MILCVYDTILYCSGLYTFRATSPDIRLSCSQQLGRLKAKAQHELFMQYCYYRRET